MKVVYVTGCLGFIGSHITELCLNLGWYVYGVDKCTYASNIEILKKFQRFKNFIFNNIDICNLERLIDCDYIINTAAESHVDNSIRKSEEFMHSNIYGVHNLLELIKNYKKEGYSLPTLLHFSTDEVYGDIINGEHLETDTLKPSNPYSATKASADMLIMAWSRTYNLPYIILRPTNNYGIGQYVEKLIPKSCKYLSLNRKIPLHQNGSPIRNWLHAKDTARAVITIIEKGESNEIYNISGGFEQSNLDTVKKIIDCYFESNTIEHSDFISFDVERPGQDVRYALNDQKLRSLGWKPECVFDEEIKSIVEYYKNNFIW